VARAGLAGGIFRYPLGTVLPTDATSVRPTISGWNPRLGGCDETGFTVSSKRDKDNKRDWNGDKVRSIQTGKDDTGKFVLIEPKSPQAKAMLYGDANVTVVPATASHGTQITAQSTSDVLPHHSYVVDTIDGDDKIRTCIADAQVSETGDIIFQSKDWTVYEITLEMFPDSQGRTWVEYTELNDILVPSEWDVAISGSAGTVVYTVTRDSVSESTTALAYNVATTALKTAIEALPNVGAGNATVTGTAGT
ncbi:hypothetical protein, partial [Mycolicibacterium fortuitum]|uniref:phage tail tube protein n=1 Tax=Mycolicibacterium fortuitum TaxID=1766 RepID=UPI0007EA6DF4